MNFVGSMSLPEFVDFSASMAQICFMAAVPISRMGWRTVVRTGETYSAKYESSNPAITISAGTRKPLCVKERRHPSAILSFAAKIASGLCEAKISFIASYPLRVE